MDSRSEAKRKISCKLNLKEINSLIVLKHTRKKKGGKRISKFFFMCS